MDYFSDSVAADCRRDRSKIVHNISSRPACYLSMAVFMGPASLHVAASKLRLRHVGSVPKPGRRGFAQRLSF
jgi:hypothetical protein